MSDKPPPYAQVPGSPPPYPQTGYAAGPPGFIAEGSYPIQPPYPLHPGYPVQGPTSPQAPVILQPAPTQLVFSPSFGRDPCTLTCPNCHRLVSTTIVYEAGILVWLLCAIIAVLGGWLFCCLIPFCVDGCKDATHYCPECRARLGSYRAL